MKPIEKMSKALPPHVPVLRVKAWANALVNSGALVPVRIEPKPVSHDGWFITPTGLGWWGSDGRGDPCVETPTHYYDYNHCYPVRLVPITEWEDEK